MSLWIPLDVDFHDHPKTQKLCRLLRLSTAEAYVTRVWTWCAKFYKNGRPDLALLEERARWRGKPGALVEALRECGFLDPDGSLHNWPGRAGAALEKIEAKRKADRERKAGLVSAGVPSEVARNSAGSRAEVARKSRGIPQEVATQTKTTQEGEKKESEETPQPPAGEVEAVQRIVAHYLTVWPRARYSITDKRRDKIRTRLKEFSEADICLAISNSAKDNWPDRHKFSDLVDHLLWTQEDVEKWLNFKPKKPADDFIFLGESHESLYGKK